MWQSNWTTSVPLACTDISDCSLHERHKAIKNSLFSPTFWPNPYSVYIYNHCVALLFIVQLVHISDGPGSPISHWFTKLGLLRGKGVVGIHTIHTGAWNTYSERSGITRPSGIGELRKRIIDICIVCIDTGPAGDACCLGPWAWAEYYTHSLLYRPDHSPSLSVPISISRVFQTDIHTHIYIYMLLICMCLMSFLV